MPALQEPQSPSAEMDKAPTVLEPLKDSDGNIMTLQDDYLMMLNGIRRKDPLQRACIALGISFPKSASLDRLRLAILDHWYPGETSQDTSSERLSSSRHVSTEYESDSTLLAELGIDDEDADEVLGYSSDEEDGEEEDGEEGEDLEDLMDDETDSEAEFQQFKRRVRVEETKRAETTRRPGGIKTQAAVVRDWKKFVETSLEKKDIRDDIVDEHHLLLYLRYSSERPKRTRKGQDIPGTLLGASQIKKLYFGALRIRKQQEAEDPKIKDTRPFNTVHVWDVVRGRMNESLNRVRNGLVPGEDAQDIVANTFLAGITPEQMTKVGEGFLKHRELRCVVNGHLAWTAQNASGNRGDDFRALKLAELQPYVFLHPNKQTAVECVLGCQGEEKAGASRGLRTKVNPVYSVFIAHREPTMCPLGAFAFYHHFIHDVIDITALAKIEWELNSTWRQIRVLHGKKEPKTPYHEQSLYNLYVKAFQVAEFISRIKQHLPRHTLPYIQEQMGVDVTQTAAMGWSRGGAFYNNYAPAIPKDAVLGAHGYKVHEVYDPAWRHVHVPEQFLALVCPMAEAIHSRIVGRENLSGAANYWSMVISTRPYVFQCGAAIYQKCPSSGLFRLPALANKDVQNWMKFEYPKSLALLKAKEGSEIDFQRIQNHELRLSLEELRALLQETSTELKAVRQLLQRRTDCLSPTKTFSNTSYQDRREYAVSTFESSQTRIPAPIFTTPMYLPSTLSSFSSSPLQSSFQMDSAHPDSYISDEEINDADNSVQILQTSAPQSQQPTVQVDLVLPTAAAFSAPGEPQFFWPPILGQRSVTWDEVLKLIKRPEMVWECWKPSRTLDKYSLDDQWTCYNAGERVFNNLGAQTGVKPPLRLVELYFQSRWRKDKSARKQWERFREIPEYIDAESLSRGVSPQNVIDKLCDLQKNSNGKLKGLSALSKFIKQERFDRAKSNKSSQSVTTTTPTKASASHLMSANPNASLLSDRPGLVLQPVRENIGHTSGHPEPPGHEPVLASEVATGQKDSASLVAKKRQPPIDNRRRVKKRKRSSS